MQSKGEEDTKPQVEPERARQFLLEVYGINVIDEGLRPLPSYDDQNFRVIAEDGKQLVLKISKTDENKDFLDLQVKAVSWLVDRGITAPVPIPSSDGLFITELTSGGKTHFVRILEFIEGKMLKDVPHTTSLLKSVGKYVAQMDKAWQDFSHPKMWRENFGWDLKNALNLRAFLPSLHKRQTPAHKIEFFII
jgi:Ser/Thr protein kinase RdoA (MazF antagonist)